MLPHPGQTLPGYGPSPPGKPRVLFCSYHSYFDPSSGAALATRDLLELLAGRGWPCGVLCGAQTDFENPQDFEQLLAVHGLPYRKADGPPCGAPFSVYHFTQGGVPVTIYRAHGLRPAEPPGPDSGTQFLTLFDGVADRFRPDLVLTFGGDWIAGQLIARAKARGLRVVFQLHNTAYSEADLFRPVDAVQVPSEFARGFYRRVLGLTCTALPFPVGWARVRCDAAEPRYLTFVNPQPAKGVFVFARIAYELGRRRPDIPLLVVEGRAKAEWVGRCGLDLSGLRNVAVMGNTPDPRDFYRVTRAILVPSLLGESFGRVAAEAAVNGIPALCTRRGGLPEALGDSGFLFDLPVRYTAEFGVAPSAAEVAPWLETVERLWDDGDFYESERLRSLRSAEAWRPERLARSYENFLRAVLAGAAPRPFDPPGTSV